ncbi:SusC/RagA family TonB-linked outer membrane protein [Ohtaekwangia kribbensis]|jgi:TonB-linked SusC/RagA family outer membrane protein|uniref:SusC/RagA family TonB-linked outer membrane protein n=1 Tax=Ohtaekwangia kribbensis TaxID=688913 RepID=A0ABW3K427_9BACT
MNQTLLKNSNSLGTALSRASLILAAWLFALGAYAQTTVSGRITSGEDSSPLPGVNILVKGTSIGTISDVEGRYSINAPSTDATLVFSFVGYISQEVPLAGRTSVDIVLATDATQLSEVVVTALGIEKDKAKVGYAVQDVKGSDLVKAREPNPVNSLVGKVAGLTVAPSAEILGAPQLYLRGKKPLFVVDGVPIQSDTWNISADDIESYTVLKGPAASALYGSRGMYGAIQITTKRGSKDKRGFSVEFNSSTMVENGFLTIPKVQSEYGPGDHGKYAFGNGKGGGKNDSDYDIWGPKFEGQLIPQYDGEYTPGTEYTTTFADGTTYTGNIRPTQWVARGKDNLQRFLQTGVVATNNLAVSTSGENHDLRFSYSHNYQRGLVPNTDLNADNFNIAAGVNLSPKIKFESNINYNRQYTENIPDVNYGPNSMIYNIILWGGADWDVDDMKQIWQPGKEGIQQVYAEYTRYNNPWFLAKYWLRGHYKTDVYGYMSLKAEIAPGLEVMGRTQINTYDLLRTEKFPYSATVYGREQAKGDYREDKRQLFENNTDIMLTFDKNITPDFTLKASLGGNLRTFTYRSSYTTTDYLSVPGLYNFTNSLNPIRAYNFNSTMQVGSGYGYIDLDYQNFLALSLTGRMDKQSTLPKGNNSFFYPSASLSAILSEKISLPEVISFLKVRGSYARVGGALTTSTIAPSYIYSGDGQSPLGYGAEYYTPYDGPSFVNTEAYRGGKLFNNIPGAYYSDRLSNENLEPSFSSTWETGLDIKFLQNRLGFDVAYFQSLDGPGIFNKQISETSGYTTIVSNGIKTLRKGWEVTISGTPIQTNEGFTWNVLVNGSTYKEYLNEIAPGIDRIEASFFNGSINGNNSFIYKGDRIDKYYGEVFLKDQQGNLINDDSGRPIANPIPQYLGNLNPDLVWGINNKFSYKNISFSFQFDGRIGGKIVDYVQRQTYRGGRHINTTEGAMGEARYQDYLGNKSWVGPGVSVAGGNIQTDDNGNIINYDELQFTPNTTATFLQDWISRYYSKEEANLVSRSYAKLREVVVTYNFPSAMLERTFIRNASVSLIARNLLYFAERKDLDIDQYGNNLSGYSTLQTPTTRRYGININITF